MLKHYLTVALRHLGRQKGYAFINVAGLAGGIACCMLTGRFQNAAFDGIAHALDVVEGPSRVGDLVRWARTGEAPADELIVRAGRLLDPASGRVASNVVLVVRDGRIAERIEGPWTPPPGIRVLDLSRFTVLPGLIDTHVHLTLGGNPADNARATLLAGFTTVADLGSVARTALSLRDATASDPTAGPRVLAAGSWIGARGGVCEFGGATVDGPAEAEDRAQQDVAAGADLLKVCVTSWLAPAVAEPEAVEFGGASLDAVAAVGAGREVPLVAHAIGQAGVREGLRAGVRWLAHTPVVDAETAAEVAHAGACVSTTTTTLLPGDDTGALRASFARLRAAGVRLALGTDAGVLAHGANARELASLASLGLAPLDALRAATTGAAECLGLGAAYASLQPGAPADLVAVDGNPLLDLSLLQHPAAVLRAGVVVREPGDTDN